MDKKILKALKSQTGFNPNLDMNIVINLNSKQEPLDDENIPSVEDRAVTEDSTAKQPEKSGVVVLCFYFKI